MAILSQLERQLSSMDVTNIRVTWFVFYPLLSSELAIFASLSQSGYSDVIEVKQWQLLVHSLVIFGWWFSSFRIPATFQVVTLAARERTFLATSDL